MKTTYLLVCGLALLATAAAQDEEPPKEEAGEGKPKKKKEEEGNWKDPARKKKAENFAYCEYDNCYELLGVSRTSGPIPIKRAYRKFSKEFHPDRCESGDAAECARVFPKYAQAYEVLSSTEMRANYDYVLDNPYEFPGFYMKYSRPKYAPKSDLRFVFLVTIIGASAMQYLLRKSQHEQAFAAIKRAPTTRYQERVKDMMAALAKSKPKAEAKEAATPPADKDGKAPPSPSKAKKATKAEQQEALRKEAEEAVDAELLELLGAAPSPYDGVAADLFKVPLTTMSTVSWYLAGGHKEPAYMTRKALGLSALEWDDCAEEEQAELVAKELWVSANLTAYEEQTSQGPKPKSGKEKRAARLAKKNPGTTVMED